MQAEQDRSAPRRAAIRGAVCAVVLAVLIVACELVAFSIRGWPGGAFGGSPIGAPGVVLIGAALSGILAGCAFAPITLVEILFARRRPSGRRDLAGGAATLGVAFLVLTLAFLQFWYSLNVVLTGSFDTGQKELLRLLGWFGDFPTEFARCIAAGAVPFGLLATSRLHGQTLPAQTVVTGVGTALLATPLLLSVRESWYEIPREDMLAWIVLASFLVPLLVRIADALEGRLVARLSGTSRFSEASSESENPVDRARARSSSR